MKGPEMMAEVEPGQAVPTLRTEVTLEKELKPSSCPDRSH
jgi:hypothetical protein